MVGGECLAAQWISHRVSIFAAQLPVVDTTGTIAEAESMARSRPQGLRICRAVRQINPAHLGGIFAAARMKMRGPGGEQDPFEGLDPKTAPPTSEIDIV